MPKTIIEQFNLGGLADSKYSGGKGSVARILGANLHSTPGLLEAAQKLTKDSGSTITEFCKSSLACSDGNTYFPSSDSGKIWKRTSGGTYSLAHTTTPERGGAACLGIIEYNGFIYWVTERRLHRIKVSLTSDWATNAEEDWAKLGVDQTIGGTGQTYIPPTSIAETAAARQTFVPSKRRLQEVMIEVNAKGTGDWTLTVHDSSNVSIGSATITNANLATGRQFFQFASALELVKLATYHIHVTSTVADGTLKTNAASDLEGGSVETHVPCDTEFHPIREQNLVLYIGNGQYIAQVDDVTFSPFALDIWEPNRIKCLGKLGTDLLLGTFIADTVNKANVIRWNTWSISFTTSDDIPEAGINAFLDSDNFVIVNAGLAGNLYNYDGNLLEPFKRVPAGNATYSPTATTVVHPNAVGNLNGLMLFGLSNKTGNPADQGVYVLGHYDKGYPIVLSLDFPISTGNLTGVEIGSIVVSGNDVFIAWKDTTGSTSYGVDKLDWSNKYSGMIIESRLFSASRDSLRTTNKIVVAYDEYPANTTITIKYKRQKDTSWQTLTSKKDAERYFVIAEITLDHATLQIRVETTASGNNAPKLQSITVGL